MFKKILNGFGIGLVGLIAFVLTCHILPFVVVWSHRNSDLDEDEFMKQHDDYCSRLIRKYTVIGLFRSKE